MLTAVPIGFTPEAPVFVIGRGDPTRRLVTAGAGLASPPFGCCIVDEIGIARGVPTPGSSGT